MSKEIIKQAWDLAEKESQEKEVQKVKGVITAYLEKLDKQKAIVKKEQETLRLLEKDLDDLKAGRLDKIEERQKLDEKAKETSLIYISRVEKEYIPMYPWRSPYWVEWNPIYIQYQTLQQGNSANLHYTCLDNTSFSTVNTAMLLDSSSNTMVVNGNTFSNFSGGTYEVNGHVISI